VEIGFVGLGKMGRPMTEHLIKAGHRVHVHNRSRGVVDELAARGAVAAANPREVAERADVVMTCLTNTPAVEEVYFGANGLYAAARAGQIFIDHSTVGLETSHKCADGARAKGADFLDAPVSGGPAGAQGGTLTIMVGGDQSTFERARPVLEIYGAKENIRLCGPTAAGSAIKLVNQLLVAINTAGVAEALVFGLKAGANPQTILDVVGSGFGGSRMLSRNVPLVLDRNFKAGTPVSLIVKDLGLISELAGELGTPLEMGARAREVFQRAADLGLADDDMSGLLRPYEQKAGVEVKRQ
jgi:3-hydroxyisobutyrate dehydrogenase-like beta-hydroxyacid dehydrogenase